MGEDHFACWFLAWLGAGVGMACLASCLMIQHRIFLKERDLFKEREKGTDTRVEM